ncbi:MAG: hypothetical protein PHN89_04460 [Candidatus Pacebacteria bacterium]|nr:hypothetical protein [Candidatus Paceibacterota bacterium]
MNSKQAPEAKGDAQAETNSGTITKGQNKLNEICDNCDRTTELAFIRYTTKRKKVNLMLCPECLEQFSELLSELKRDAI